MLIFLTGTPGTEPLYHSSGPLRGIRFKGRKKPIGAWILQDGKLDYAFDPAYPDDEAIPSDLHKHGLVVDAKLLGLKGLTHWRGHVGYTRSGSGFMKRRCWVALGGFEPPRRLSRSDNSLTLSFEK